MLDTNVVSKRDTPVKFSTKKFTIIKSYGCCRLLNKMTNSNPYFLGFIDSNPFKYVPLSPFMNEINIVTHGIGLRTYLIQSTFRA